MMRPVLLLSLLMLAGASGCDLGLDPDGLVRELRVLDARVGQPGGIADLADVQLGTLRLLPPHLAGLAPSIGGPGRRLSAEPPVTLSFYLCATSRSLLDTGSIDPACEAFPGVPQTPQPGVVSPPPDQNPSLIPLGTGAQIDVSVATLQKAFVGLLATGPQNPPPGPTQGLIDLQLPIVLHANIKAGSTDPLDNETAFFFARVVLAPAGMDPATSPLHPINRNPTLMSVMASLTGDANDQPQSPVALTPCPAAGPCQPSFSVRRGQPIFLLATSTQDSVERYTPLDQSGRGEIAETLRYSWFATDGKYTQERTGDMQPQTKWQNDDASFPAPAAVHEVQLWVLVQDDRGGNDWQRFLVQLSQ